VWYQGENNCHGFPGNSADNTGYGCDQVALVALWRQEWAANSGTAADAPFGVTSLAAGGSEGAGQHMAAIRWAQTGNHGALPNPAMPSTFMAHAYDIGDPWGNDGCRNCNCSRVNPATNKTDPDCIPWDDSAWNSAVKPIAPLVHNNSAPFFMGAIHPRFKHEVGRRLATALLKNTSGPTIAGCTLSGGAIELRLDPSRLTPGEGVVVQPFNTNVSQWENKGTDSSSLMLCSSGLGGNSTTCGCLGWNYLRVPNPNDPNNTGHDMAQWYCENGPGWKPDEKDLRLMRRRRLETPRQLGDRTVVGGPDRLGWVPNANPYVNAWVPGVLKPGLTVVAAEEPALAVEVELVGFNGTVLAMRYGWPLSTDTCCPFESVRNGLEVCRPASCPVMSAQTNLPLNPFFATMSGGRCKCTRPQQCDL